MTFDKVTWGGSQVTVNAEQLNRIEQGIEDATNTVASVESDVLGQSYVVAAPTGTEATDTANIQAGIDAMNTAGGGVVTLRDGDYSITTLSLAGKDNVTVRGRGIGATTLITSNTTGNVVDMTDTSFCEFSDMLIRPSAQRTAGAAFYVDAGAAGSAQQNRFRRLRMASSYRAFHLDDCTTTLIDDVQFLDTNAAWTWHSMIHLAGTTTSTYIHRLRGGSAATVTNGLCYISGAGVDTVIGDTWDVLNLGGTGMKGLNIANGQWIRFNNLSIESGTTEDAVTVSAGKSITLTNSHLLGLRGAHISGGKSVSLIGGEIIQCQQGGVRISGGTFIRVSDMEISDISEATNNTWRGIQVDGGMVDFTITNNVIGNHILGTSTPQYGILLSAGATNRFVITGNRFTNFSIDSISNGATGTSQVVANNAPEQIQTIASAATLTLPGGPLVFVSGTTNVTGMTAGQAGRVITLKFTGALTFTDGSNLVLNGNFVTTADDTITLVSDGGNWIEIARSTN